MIALPLINMYNHFNVTHNWLAKRTWNNIYTDLLHTHTMIRINLCFAVVIIKFPSATTWRQAN